MEAGGCRANKNGAPAPALFEYYTRKPHRVRNSTVRTILAGSPPNETSTQGYIFMVSDDRPVQLIFFTRFRVARYRTGKQNQGLSSPSEVPFLEVENLRLEIFSIFLLVTPCGIFNIFPFPFVVQLSPKFAIFVSIQDKLLSIIPALE